MVTRTKLLIIGTLLFAATSYAWTDRDVDITIAGVSFRFPAQAVISSQSIGVRSNELDRNEGAFIVLPGGPYHGKWGILLQSSRDRAGDGVPSAVKMALNSGDNVFTPTSFGWFACDTKCGRGKWFFRRIPNGTDSTDSVGTVLCYKTNICKLSLSYGAVDVQVSMQLERVSQASEVMRQVGEVLRNHDNAKDRAP